MRDLDALFGKFEVEASVHIEAPRIRVWELITDVGRMGEFSPELVRVEWLEGGPQELVAGARFAGTNRLGGFEWTRTCTVVEVKEPDVFAYVVGDRFDGSPSGTWSFELRSDGGGTIVVQRFSHAPNGRSGTRLLADQEPEMAEKLIEQRREVLERGMQSTLEGMRQALERG